MENSQAIASDQIQAILVATASQQLSAFNIGILMLNDFLETYFQNKIL
jgi:hypothetical protein